MPNYFALVPAAGTGSRMGEGLAKQYLPLAGRPMIYHAVRTLCQCSRISQVYVVLSVNDKTWPEYDWSEFTGSLKPLYCGGATRAGSVLNGLKAAQDQIRSDDWVLVHDAVRPCLAAGKLDTLLNELAGDEVGGLLAVPVADTLKRDDGDGRVMRTEQRDQLWQAQTPQMFRCGLLLRALDGAQGLDPTDESSAVEALGLKPKLVKGDAHNLKVTYPEDLALAETILKVVGWVEAR